MTKTALVTGAASGIGFELSLLLAKDSYNLILVDIDLARLKDAKNYIQKIYNCQIITLIKDLSKPDMSREIIDDINDISIDVLVNNAGFGLFGVFSRTSWQCESEMLNLHIHTTTHLTKLVLKQMLKQGNGKILNVASLAAFQPGPLMALYYASKAYILSFSEAIANELIGTGITLTVLCPGQTQTAFQGVVSQTASEAKNNFNIACPKKVAEYGYQAMLKGKTVAIPGRFNKLISILPRLVPRRIAVSVVRKLQENNRRSA